MRSASLICLAALVSFATVVTSCRKGLPPPPPLRTVSVWCQAHSEAEENALRGIASSFNVAYQHRGVRVALEFVPPENFAARLDEAFDLASRPDTFALGGPLVAHYAHAGLITPLDSWFDRNELEDFIPTAREQGSVGGRLYALASLEAAAALYYDHEMLARADVVVPPEGRAWTWSQFLAACARLQQAGITPVALHLDADDEAVFRAFSPVIWSGGGELVGGDGRRVEGIFASPENIASLQAWQTLFAQHYAIIAEPGTNPFAEGRVAFDWNSHLAARPHLRRKGDTLRAMLLPRLGTRAVVPCGNWGWAISKRARDPETAALWVKWVTDLRHGVEPLVRATGGVPARRSAFALFPEYSRPPYRLFRDHLELSGRPQPHTPFFGRIATEFAQALRDIARGAKVESRLHAAERHLAETIRRESDAARATE